MVPMFFEGRLFSFDLDNINVVVIPERVTFSEKIRQPPNGDFRQQALRKAVSCGLAHRHLEDHSLRQATAERIREQNAIEGTHYRHRLRLPQRARLNRPRQPYLSPHAGTHAKLEVYMVEEIEHPSIYSQLASPALLKSAVFVIMLDFTAPWNFVQEIEKWVRFIYDLQQMAQLSIADLEEMAAKSNSFHMQPHAGINSSERQNSMRMAS